MANVPGIPVYKEIGATPAPAAAKDSARVVIVGAGPIGLATALDLGRRGHPVTVLNRLDFIAHCSKAICFSKRTIDILDRLGVGDRVVEKGVTWNVGKVFWGEGAEPIYQFDLLPVKEQKRPGFINIQQYYIEEYLLDGVQALPNVEIRWGHRVDAVTPRNDGVELTVTAADGAYTLKAEWLIACDGARSTVRDRLGLDFARPFVNSGRLSTPVSYPASRLSTPDAEPWANGVAPGSPVLDAPHGQGWLLDALGDDFVLIARGWRGAVPAGLRLVEVEGVAADRLRLADGAACLVRPDQYVATRWKTADPAAVEAALIRAKGGELWPN